MGTPTLRVFVLSLQQFVLLCSVSAVVRGQWNLGNIGSQLGLDLTGQQGGGGQGGGLGTLLGGIVGGQQQQGQPAGPQQQRPAVGGQQPAGGGGLGGGVEQMLNNIGLNHQFTHSLGQQIDGVATQFYAPSPTGPIPPHVQRRIMRFCTQHPQDPKCQGHPEWIIPQGQMPTAPQVGGGMVDLNQMFPNLIPIQIPPIPQLQIKDLLAGVPDLLKQVLPPNMAGQINAIARQALESVCASGQCLQQKPEFLNQRATLAEFESAIARTLVPGKPIDQVDKDVETRLARTFQVKKALLKKAGLEGKVEPANNGIFQHDLLLTEQQSNALINQINTNRVGQGVVEHPGRLKRAGNSVFFENSPNQKWWTGQPISYTFDQSVTENDRGSVRAAIGEIQSKSCLTFQEVASKPSGPHLYYVKIANPSFCGLSYVGRIDPANPIYLSFMCGNPMGVAIHETLHAMGLQHEHLRMDRDNFITINWENVNPQNYDFFATSDMTKFTSYGIQYDYGSVMHYASTIASQNYGKKTMTAKNDPATNDPRMGQRQGMSQTDVDALNKMYCQPQCQDANVYCGYWATNNQCEANQQWMSQNCQKSCNLCGGWNKK